MHGKAYQNTYALEKFSKNEKIEVQQMAKPSAEKRTEATPERPTHALTVVQPKKLEGLLDTINLLNEVTERIGEDRSGDLGGGGMAGATQGQQGQSWRDQAIAHLPETAAMQKQLTDHIQTEVRGLRREARRLSHRTTKKGVAHKLTELYARIRRLNGLLTELLETSVDVIRRLYIRIFVDKQAVL